MGEKKTGGQTLSNLETREFEGDGWLVDGGEESRLVLGDVDSEGNLLCCEGSDIHVRDEPAEYIHSILVQNLYQLLAGGVAGEGVLRPRAPLYQVPHTDLPAGSQCVDQIHLLRVVCMVLGAGDDGKHCHYLLGYFLQLGEPTPDHNLHLILPQAGDGHCPDKLDLHKDPTCSFCVRNN